MVRHFFYDWDTEVASSLSIERIGARRRAGAPRPAEDPRAVVARQLIALGRLRRRQPRVLLAILPARGAQHVPPPLDGTAMGGAAENRPVIGSWELGPDEALLVEVAPPQGLYWSFSLGNPWWETIDYGRAPEQPERAPGGGRRRRDLRAVIAHDDPGVANWLDTAGHSAGPVILRCVRTETAPVPTTRVVPFSDIAGIAASGYASGHARRATGHVGGPAPRREQAVLPMTLDADALEAAAREETGLDDFGDGDAPRGARAPGAVLQRRGRPHRDGRGHAAHPAGHVCCRPACGWRTPIAPTRPSRTEEVEGPVFVIGLPRTGTTALSQLVAADPQFRSLRLWESSFALPASRDGHRAHRPAHRGHRGRAWR